MKYSLDLSAQRAWYHITMNIYSITNWASKSHSLSKGLGLIKEIADYEWLTKEKVDELGTSIHARMLGSFLGKSFGITNLPVTPLPVIAVLGTGIRTN